MKHFHKQRLLKLADFLQKLPKRLFDLNIIISVEEPEKGFAPNCNLSTAIKCGTTACAIGWTPSVFPRHLKWDNENCCVALKKANKSGSYYDNYEEIDFGAVEQFFEINSNQAEYLFQPESYLEDKKSAKDVAKRIRKFVHNNVALPESFVLPSNRW